MATQSNHRTDESVSPSKQQVTEETIEELLPSAKLVIKVLEQEGALRQQQLMEKTRLPQRTVRAATSRLVEMDVIAERPYLRDVRQSTYRLVPEFLRA